MMLIAGAIAGLMVVGGTTMTIARKTTAKKTAAKKTPATKAVHKPGTKATVKRPARVTDRISGKTVTDPRPAVHYPQIERVRAAHLAGDAFPSRECLEQFRKVVLELDHGVYPRATEAWEHAEHRVAEHDITKWPRGSAGFFGPGSTGAGHIVLNTGDAKGWTPGGPDDLTHWYHTDLIDIIERWGMKPYGYTLDVDGRSVGPVHGHR